MLSKKKNLKIYQLTKKEISSYLQTNVLMQIVEYEMFSQTL